ncbi:MMPL family transporter [Actinomadura xylanilytica]|uniref:MMPL family transporter n=1 Tax=Actinomadura xylanilytica TaxID=887459 RepID=UPI00255B1F48|nr:MMPL family transporter [Actinomadura xylanilytica]MDL4775828.1 MMPL family transporter [Actinomadura xylanilytica]
MFDRIAELAIRRSRLVLVVATLAVALMGVVGAGAFAKLVGGGFDDPASESTRAGRVIDEKFGGETNLVLLVRAPEGGVDAAAAKQSGQALAADLKKEHDLENVISYWDTGSPDLRSKDGRQAMVLATMKGEDKEQEENLQGILDAYTGPDKGGLSVQAGGATAVAGELSTQVVSDLVLAESIAVPLTLVLLLVVFGSVVAAVLPLIIGTIAIVGTFAELALLGGFTDVSVFATNLTTALGLGLGIDYALLMINRFREQLAAGRR